MASTIAISCPKCEKQIKAPAELAGKKIRCKECQHVFAVPASAARPAVKAADKGGKPDKGAAKGAKDGAPAKGPIEEADANPYGVTDHSFLPRCPYCAKELDDDEQVICLNCGYNRRTRERIKTEKTLEPTAGEWIIHLLPGIICAVLSLLAIGGLVFIWFNRAERAADYGNDAFFNPFSLGIALWESVISLFIGFFTGRFAIKRLVLHTRPPEREMKTTKKH